MYIYFFNYMKSALPHRIRPKLCVFFLITFLLGYSAFPSWNIRRRALLLVFPCIFEYVVMKKKKVHRLFKSHPALERATFCCLAYLLASIMSSKLPVGHNHDKVSIVIPSRFEKDYIAQTVMYVFQDTRPEILHEVVLVDDQSEFPVAPIIQTALEPGGMLDFLTPYERHKIIIVRNEKQEGLIRGKIQGGNVATGTHIFFLDGHCRTNPGYMEKLLDRINEGTYKRIVVPAVQDVNGTDWSFKNAIGAKMMFAWNFEFDWFDDGTDEVPIMSGGLLLMTKKFWDETGYDEGMLDWGGENIEQSMHAWLCGGDIVVERKSVVGHIFARPQPKDKVRPYQVEKNQARAAYAWLDEYYNVFADAQPKVKSFENFGVPMEPMMVKRMSSTCRPFTDFMARFREVFQRRALFIKSFHHLMDVATGLCLTGYDEKDSTKSQLSFKTCDPSDALQQWGVISHGRRLINQRAIKCLDRANAPDDGSKMAILFACDFSSNQNQNWYFSGEETSRGRSNFGMSELNGQIGHIGHIQMMENSIRGSLQPIRPMRQPTSVCLDNKGHVNTCNNGAVFKWLW